MLAFVDLDERVPGDGGLDGSAVLLHSRAVKP